LAECARAGDTAAYGPDDAGSGSRRALKKTAAINTVIAIVTKNYFG
jgi:hypothetical protein